MTTTTKSRNIGAHVSAAGGIDKAVARAAAIGCNCVQVFAGSPRGWKRPQLADIPVTLIKQTQSQLQVDLVVTHALYLVNIASDAPELVDKSVEALSADLRFDAAIAGGGVVVHLGSHQGRGWEAVRSQVLHVIDQILKKTPDKSTFLIENSAGQNGKIASNLNEVAWILEQLEETAGWVSQGRVGWCFDTCHAWAAGYYLGQQQPEGVDEKNGVRGQAAAVISQLNLWPTLKVVHVNDSKDGFGSGRDRHENIGQGSIPEKDLAVFLNLPQILDVPLLTEVPGLDGHGPDEPNVSRIKSLCHQS